MATEFDYIKGNGSIVPLEDEPCRKWRLMVCINKPDEKGKYPRRSKRFNGSRRAAEKALTAFKAELQEEYAHADERAAQERDNRSKAVAMAEAQEQIDILKAQLRAAEKKLEIEREIHEAPKDTPLLDDYAHDWLEYRRNTKSVAYATLHNDEVRIQTLLKHLGGMHLHEISPAEVRRFYAGMMGKGGGLSGEALSGTTAQDYAVTFTQIMKQAVNDGLLAKSPCDGVKLPRIDTKERRGLTEEELRSLLREIGATPSDPREVGVLLALHCGLRRGEVCALRWCDVDLEERHLTVNHSFSQARTNDGALEGLKTPKTHKPRRIPLNDAMVAALKSWRMTQREQLMVLGLPQDGERPVISNQFGGFTRPTNWANWWTKYTKKLGVDVTLHQLRHTFANTLKDAGVPLRDAMVLMGHKDSSMLLKVYQHASDAALVDAVSKVGELMEDGAKPAEVITVSRKTA